MKKIFLYFFCFLIINQLFSQKLPESFIRSSVYISYLKKQDSTIKRVSGTGFLLFHLTDSVKKLGNIILITNKHVLPKYIESKTISVKFPIKTEKGIISDELKIDIYNAKNILNENVKFHKDKNTDIAAIDITSILILKKLDQIVNRIPSDFLLRKSDYKNSKIGLGDEVFILGYPSSIDDSRTILPIVRQGIISSDPYSDFYFNETFKKDSILPNPLKGFLIDGSIFSGSSGSVVILKTSYEMVDRKFTFVKEKSHVLGIISHNISIKDQSINLGIVFSSECIWELVREFN